ncbi:MAG: type 1 glutamine amidotransferase [Deltaproteobacteria bacterium]|nr:type 1 glutamine amidotransferase [Deltaproteobacteria bacterium]
MRLHYFQHVSFEGLGSIEPWAKEMAYEITSTRVFTEDPFPNLDDIDWLIVMGGSIGIYEEDKYPWICAEKNYIEQAVVQGKIVLGICLGAQLIADVLGAKIYPCKYKEIGWFPIQKTRETSETRLADFLPVEIDAFHWHGDMFDIPNGAIHIAKSAACENQGFIYDDHVVALQFHLETMEQSAKDLIANCQDDITEGPFVQSSAEIFADTKRFGKINLLMSELLMVS